MEYKITHIPEENRFQTIVDGHVGYVEYVQRKGSIDIVHTIVPREIEGRGVASALVKAAYDYAIKNDLKVIVSCAYARGWSHRHPEYADITLQSAY